MPVNDDSVMVVCKHVGASAPHGWTKITGKDLIARRLAYGDAYKLSLPGFKVVLAKVYQQNAGGGQAFATEYAGNDGYSFEQDQSGDLLVSKYNAAGGQAGTVRAQHKTSANGGSQVTESWPKESGQVPMLGVVFQDAAPSSQLLADAQAVDPANIGLG